MDHSFIYLKLVELTDDIADINYNSSAAHFRTRQMFQLL
jgi:hypothetical protein